MASPKNRVPLAGSERSPMPGAREIGPANPNEVIEVTVRLRSRGGKTQPVSASTFRQLPAERPILSREELEKIHGADPASVNRVGDFARQHGLTVVETSPGRRTLVLSGTVDAMSKAFEVELKQYEHPTGQYRGRIGEIHIPADLQDIVEGVFGLDNRPQAKPHFRRRRGQPSIHAQAASVSYTPPQLAAIYDFPTNVDGTGECIAIIELGGGFQQTDLKTYFDQLGLPTPMVTAVSVRKGSNAPTGDPGGPDGEVMLDIEVAGGVAPGAAIVVYFAENTDAGFLNAITTAVHDKTYKPSIISISWGGPESNWTSQAMTSMDEAFQSAAALGITVCVASGDEGSTDGVSDGLNHVDFPASSPNVLACGGTKLEASNNKLTRETVWNELSNNEGATGGGISDVFALPPWQTNAGVPVSANPKKNLGRGLPDVSGDADPTTGYITRVDGQADVIGGTSAVAPLWAGLIALINESLGKPAGFVNPLLYEKAALGSFRDVIEGNNGAYSAARGWDACSGLGTPIGTQIAVLLGAKPPKEARRTGTGD
jgi:kumamolisin